MKFSQKVLLEVMKLKKGEITTYSEIAKRAGSQKASRAVGNILNRCKDSYYLGGKIPCHRVIRKDNSIGGFAYGSNEKIKLLILEGNKIKLGKLSK